VSFEAVGNLVQKLLELSSRVWEMTLIVLSHSVLKSTIQLLAPV
jgi:hypothetical protein